MPPAHVELAVQQRKHSPSNHGADGDPSIMRLEHTLHQQQYWQEGAPGLAPV